MSSLVSTFFAVDPTKLGDKKVRGQFLYGILDLLFYLYYIVVTQRSIGTLFRNRHVAPGHYQRERYQRNNF